MGVPLKQLWFSDEDAVLEFSKPVNFALSLTPFGNRMVRILCTMFSTPGNFQMISQVDQYKIKVSRRLDINKYNAATLKARMAELDKKGKLELIVDPEGNLEDFSGSGTMVLIYARSNLHFTGYDADKLRYELKPFERMRASSKTTVQHIGSGYPGAKHYKTGDMVVVVSFQNTESLAERQKRLKQITKFLGRSKALK